MSQQNKTKKDYQRFGSMLQGKEPDFDGNKSYYIKLDDSFAEALDARFLRVERPDAAINAMVRNGQITPEEHEERLAKIPDFVKFNIVLVKELD